MSRARWQWKHSKDLLWTFTCVQQWGLILPSLIAEIFHSDSTLCHKSHMSPTDISRHHLNLKNRTRAMVICNILHPDIVNGTHQKVIPRCFIGPGRLWVRMISFRQDQTPLLVSGGWHHKSSFSYLIVICGKFSQGTRTNSQCIYSWPLFQLPFSREALRCALSCQNVHWHFSFSKGRTYSGKRSTHPQHANHSLQLSFGNGS